MEIREVDWGIANNFGDYIEINKNLNAYPQLKAAIIKHEFGHTQKKGFSGSDFVHDINEVKVSSSELLKFMLRNPKSFYQFLPFYKSGKTIFYDINLMITYGIIFGVVALSVFLAVKI